MFGLPLNNLMHIFNEFFSVGGVPYHNECPPGLHFNPLIDACDYPANVDCQDRPTLFMF